MVELDQWIEEGALAAPVLETVQAIVTADVHEDDMAQNLRDYMDEHVRSIEFASVVSDLLSAQHIISKYFYRRLYEWRGVECRVSI